MSKKKSALVFIEGKKTFTDSDIIAAGVGISPNSVVKLIRKFKADFEEFATVDFKSEVVMRKQGGGTLREVALLTEDQATYLMTLLRNNEVVRAFKIKLVKAFRSALRRISVLERQAPDWQDGRKLVALHQRGMTDKLVAVRTASGKPTQSHHFSNEALLLTFALIGKAKPPVDRGSLDEASLRLLANLEELNGGLILAGLPYEQRKDICRRFVVAGVAISEKISQGPTQ
jgi:phage regulator Rha-like protein